MEFQWFFKKKLFVKKSLEPGDFIGFFLDFQRFYTIEEIHDICEENLFNEKKTEI